MLILHSRYRGIVAIQGNHTKKMLPLCTGQNLPTKPNDDGDGDDGGDGDADVVSGGDALLSVNTVGIINTLLCQYNSALLSRHRHLHHDFHPLSTHYVPFMAIIIFAEFVIFFFFGMRPNCVGL